jgi:hypothetical protein
LYGSTVGFTSNLMATIFPLNNLIRSSLDQVLTLLWPHLPYDCVLWVWAWSLGASWFHVWRAHVVIHTPTSESQNHDPLGYGTRCPARTDDPGYFVTSCFASR